MKPENLIVRHHRRAVERFEVADNGYALDLDARMTLVDEVAGLQSALDKGALAEKPFDLLEQLWQDTTVEIVDDIRQRLRGLADPIQPAERKIVTSEFEDSTGIASNIDLPEAGSGVDKALFRLKARRFFAEHKDRISLLKLHRGETWQKLT